MAFRRECRQMEQLVSYGGPGLTFCCLMETRGSLQGRSMSEGPSQIVKVKQQTRAPGDTRERESESSDCVYVAGIPAGSNSAVCQVAVR